VLWTGLGLLNPFSGFGVASSCPAPHKSIFDPDVIVKNGFDLGRVGTGQKRIYPSQACNQHQRNQDVSL